jgi:hypothetical protein
MESQYLDSQNESNSSGNEFTGDNSYQSNLIPHSNNQIQNPPEQYYNQYPPPQPQNPPQPQPDLTYEQPQPHSPYSNDNMGYQSSDFANNPPQPQENASYNQSNVGESNKVSNKNEINVINSRIELKRLRVQILMVIFLFVFSFVDIIYQIVFNLYNIALVDDILLLLLGTLILFFTIRRQTSKRPLVSSPGVLMWFAGLIFRVVGYFYTLFFSGPFPIIMNVIKLITFVVVAGNTNYENTRMIRRRRRKYLN